MGKIMTIAGRLAREQGAGDGFRTIVNTGRVGRQEVQHVHVHVIGGPETLGPMILRNKSCKEHTMGGLSIWHWLIVLLVVVLIFGTKKLTQHRQGPGRRGEGLQGRHEDPGGRRRDDGERRAATARRFPARRSTPK